ncbi:putative Pol polyprotein [Cricetulus griseus]|uniref:Putative Pol polyprotein n=1 Tax=Cricetulus griseus TaxID=10029 RepID=A0A061HUI8_CRIGR|nr:putative Pol polyprotein [Cricetulus griseus]
MLNSPTLCQHFVQQPLEIIRKKFSQSLVYHYMDDVLLSDSNKDTLERMFEMVKEVLPRWGLQIAPEKIQRRDSINYLGYKIDLRRIRPQKVPTSAGNSWEPSGHLGLENSSLEYSSVSMRDRKLRGI